MDLKYVASHYKVRNLNIDLTTVGQIIGQVLIAKEERVRIHKKGYIASNRDAEAERWEISSASLLLSSIPMNLCRWSSPIILVQGWTGE